MHKSRFSSNYRWEDEIQVWIPEDWVKLSTLLNCIERKIHTKVHTFSTSTINLMANNNTRLCWRHLSICNLKFRTLIVLPCLKMLHHLRNKFQAYLEMHVVSYSIDLRRLAHLEKIKVHFPWQAWRQHRTWWAYHLHFLEHKEGLHWCTLTEYVSKISHSILYQSTPVLCCFSTDPMPKGKKIILWCTFSKKEKKIYSPNSVNCIQVCNLKLEI